MSDCSGSTQNDIHALEFSEKKTKIDEEDYDPFVHRIVERPTTWVRNHATQLACHFSASDRIFIELLVIQKHGHSGASAEGIVRNWYSGHAKCIPPCRLRGGNDRHNCHWHYMHVLHSHSVGRSLWPVQTETCALSDVSTDCRSFTSGRTNVDAEILALDLVSSVAMIFSKTILNLL